MFVEKNAEIQPWTKKSEKDKYLGRLVRLLPDSNLIRSFVERSLGRLISNKIDAGYNGNALASDDVLKGFGEEIRQAVVSRSPWTLAEETFNAVLDKTENADELFRIVRELAPTPISMVSPEVRQIGQHDALMFSARVGADKWLNSLGRNYGLFKDDGFPVAVIHVQGGRATELLFTENATPADFELIKKFLKENGLKATFQPNQSGMIVGKDGDWHDVNALPEGLEVDYDLFVKGDVKLPNGLKVKGSLALHGAQSLPDDMRVTDKLWVHDSPSLLVGEKVKARRVHFGNCNFSLPRSLKAEEIAIEHSSVEFAQKFSVGTLYLYSGQVKAFPSGMKMKHLVGINVKPEQIASDVMIGGKIIGEITSDERKTMGIDGVVIAQPISSGQVKSVLADRIAAASAARPSGPKI